MGLVVTNARRNAENGTAIINKLSKGFNYQNKTKCFIYFNYQNMFILELTQFIFVIEKP